MSKKKKDKVQEQAESVKIISRNRKARFNYYIEVEYEAGIELKGTEVKSIRAGKVSIEESYARFKDNELFLLGMHIKPYEFGNRFNHEPLRKRKLLLHRRELDKIAGKATERGYTIIPLQIHIKRGLVKIKIGLCKGKRLYDKRETTKEREIKRDLDRVKKDYKTR